MGVGEFEERSTVRGLRTVRSLWFMLRVSIFVGAFIDSPTVIAMHRIAMPGTMGGRSKLLAAAVAITS